MVLICFEGPQKVGKTTLIKHLVKHLKIPIWERPLEIEEFKERTNSYDMFVLDELSILNKIDWSKQDMIVDRHPAISEWVYSTLLSRKSLVPKGDLNLISDGSCFIYLRRKWEERIKKLEQSLYDAVMFSVRKKFPTLFIRTDLWNEYECTELILEFIKTLKEEER